MHIKSHIARLGVRFSGWWAACSGLVMMGGGCPCCAGGMCARGVAVFGAIGAFFAVFLKSRNEAAKTQTPNAGEAPNFTPHDFLTESSKS